jgi:hypothetical protein
VRIEAVTVCAGYGDFLEETLPRNQHLVDDLVVVTTPDDERTREVCRRHSVHCILSEEHRRGGDFNKGRLIQRAFDQIGREDWVLHLDADIVLPRQFRSLVDWAHLDEKCIYGADRVNVVGWDAWQKVKNAAWHGHQYENLVSYPKDSEFAVRWASKLHGYVPIGFFQLFHGSAMIWRGSHIRRYPYHHGDAARSDVQFALQWDRRHRQLLPEVVVLHLESQKAPLGANWNGRTTEEFGPRHRHHRHHHHHHHHKPYC